MAAEAVGRTVPRGHAELSPGRAWVALAALLTGTFLGTINNNIVNVPLRDITVDLGVPVSAGVLVVVAFSLTFAVLMPVMGWLGDRIGRRRMFCAALAGIAGGALGAALAPDLRILVAFRVVQGAATAALLPTVMGIIAALFGPDRRGRAVGMWAAVNGLGQAIGPPVGGLVSQLVGWRWMFVPIVPLALAALVLTMRLVPRDTGRPNRLDWPGATTLTVGAALLILAVTVLGQPGTPAVLTAALTVAGMVVLAVFVLVSRRVANPFIPLRLVAESVYLRSCLAVFAQMFCLGAALLAVPLHLTEGVGATSTATAGLIVFALPAAMTVLAPVAGVCTERYGARRAIRAGLVAVAVAQAVLAVELATGHGRGLDLVAALVLTGAGVAFVQTPAATGVTRSPAGRAGTGLGLFNLVRFAGAAVGAAWVAIALEHSGGFGVLFAACAVVAVAGLVGTFVGPTPTSLARPVNRPG